MSVPFIKEDECKNLLVVLEPIVSNNRSPDPPPVIVPVSNSTWILKLPVSGAIPPLTTATFAWAVPELNVNVSPSW